MPYSELHLSSEGSQRSHNSTRSHPVFELKETIIPSAFQIKYVSLPLSWCNGGGSGLIKIGQTDSPDGDKTVYSFLVPEGCYNGEQLASELQSSIRSAMLLSNGDPGQADFSTVTVSEEDDLRFKFTFPNTVWPVVQAPLPPATFTIEWGDGLKKVFNRNYNEPGTLSWDVPSGGSDIDVFSKYPIRLIPNFVYLHSNIMSGCKYGRQLRVQGGDKSNTILAKIPVRSEYVFGQQIMPFENETLQPHFMFKNDSAFSHLEFWLTDETTGEELDFQNVSFSLTLAMNFP